MEYYRSYGLSFFFIDPYFDKGFRQGSMKKGQYGIEITYLNDCPQLEIAESDVLKGIFQAI